MSLGNLSKMYGGLLPEAQRKISHLFAVHHDVLRNWLHSITYTRNICAHHSRLWNRELAIRPEIPRKDSRWNKRGLDNTRVSAISAVLEWIIRKAEISPDLMEPVYRIMLNIAREDKRFIRFMGFSDNENPGYFWI